MAIELYPHQAKALGEIHNGSILHGDVGSGKSRTALAYYVAKVCGAPLSINGVGHDGPMSRPRNLLIITTAKKRDTLEWEGELAHFALSTDFDLSFEDVSVQIDSWNNIGNYIDVEDCFVIFDEQRLVGSGAWVKSFLRIAKHNQWVLLSATPGDTWSDYIPVFLAHGFYKNRTEFLREHAVFSRFSQFPKIDHYVETHKLTRLQHSIIVDMPFVRHTKRHTQNILVSHNKEKLEKILKKRWNIYEDRPLRDVSEMFICMRRLVNTDVSRMAAVMELSEIHPKLIIFYNWNSELDILRQLGGILNIETAEWNGQKHQEIPIGDRWLYFVQYTAGSEGWNCVTTDAMVFWSLNYSYRVMEQSKGRIDRLNTPYINLNYYILRSDSLIDTAITKALASKRTFNEKELVSSW